MKRVKGITLLCLLLFLLGCSSASGGTSVWIDTPIQNLHLPTPQIIQIEGHAANPNGISQVEISVNGAQIARIQTFETTNTLSSFETGYTIPDNGEYTIQAVATGADGEISAPDTVVIFVGGTEEENTPTPIITPTEVPPAEQLEEEDQAADEPTPTYTEIPEPSVEFWADPPEIKAGECTTLYWEVANVSSVVFGGNQQDFSGSYHDCMCESQTYPLTVTYWDGSTEKHYVTINVSGACQTDTPTYTPVPPTDTPTPVPDTDAPPTPTLLKPLNGSTLACAADSILRWDAVSDPSGISEYQVQVERHPGDNNWQTVAGSPFSLSGTNQTIPVECAYTYRWRVRAIDGVGNVGSWSGWFTFTVNFG